MMKNGFARHLEIPGANAIKNICSFYCSLSGGFLFGRQMQSRQKLRLMIGRSFTGGIHEHSLRMLRNSSKFPMRSFHLSSSMLIRKFSTVDMKNEQVLSPTSTTLFTDNESGEQYSIVMDTRNLPKLKPSIVRRRLDKCRTYVGREKSIRQSPWKLNRICQLAAGLSLEDALTQLQFCDLKNAGLIAKVLRRTSNLADIRDGLQISQLEVQECFTTRSLMLRRIKPMARGRHGVMHHKFSHVRVVLREIDFPLKIYQQKSMNQKKKWLLHQQRAKKDAETANAKREELIQLEKQQEERATAAASQ